jgi:hypothetical protein
LIEAYTDEELRNHPVFKMFWNDDDFVPDEDAHQIDVRRSVK